MAHPANGKSLPPPIAMAVEAGTNLIRAIRESVGYSIEDLAVACGLTADEISEMEAGSDADPARLRRIASALGLPEDAVFEAWPGNSPDTPALKGA